MYSLKNGSSFDQPISLNGFIENSNGLTSSEKVKIYSRLLSQDDSNRQILKVVGENDGIQSRELQAKVNLSRAPILSRTKKLSEIELLVRSVVPGTERHSKPTYSYSLAPGVTTIAVGCAVAKFSIEEYLKIESGNTEIPKTQNSKATFSNFEKVQEMLEIAFQKISELESRLTQVEGILHQPDAIDRQKLLDILNSQKT